MHLRPCRGRSVFSPKCGARKHFYDTATLIRTITHLPFYGRLRRLARTRCPLVLRAILPASNELRRECLLSLRFCFHYFVVFRSSLVFIFTFSLIFIFSLILIFFICTIVSFHIISYSIYLLIYDFFSCFYYGE